MKWTRQEKYGEDNTIKIVRAQRQDNGIIMGYKKKQRGRGDINLYIYYITYRYICIYSGLMAHSVFAELVMKARCLCSNQRTVSVPYLHNFRERLQRREEAHHLTTGAVSLQVLERNADAILRLVPFVHLHAVASTCNEGTVDMLFFCRKKYIPLSRKVGILATTCLETNARLCRAA